MAEAIIPGSLIKTRYLMNVEESLWSFPRQRRVEWQESWDVAVWLHFSQPQEKPVGLVLRFSDENGDHAAVVDEATLPAASSLLMFSGRVTIPGKGRLAGMSLHCTGVQERTGIRVENLHMRLVSQASLARAG